MADSLELKRKKAKAKLKLRSRSASPSAPSEAEQKDSGLTAKKIAGYGAGAGFNVNEFAPGFGAAIGKGIAAVDKISGGRVGNVMTGNGFVPSEEQVAVAEEVIKQPGSEARQENLEFAQELSKDPEFQQAKEKASNAQSLLNAFNPIGSVATQGVKAITDNATDGAITSEDLKSGAKAAATEGALQVAGGVLASGLVKGASKLGGFSARAASKLGSKASGKSVEMLTDEVFSNQSAIKKLGGTFKKGQEKAKSIVKVLQENGLFKNGVSMQKLADTATEIAERAGKNLQVIKQELATKAPALNLSKIAPKLDDVYNKYAGRKLTSSQSNIVEKAFDDILGKFGDDATITMDNLLALKEELGEVAFAKNLTEDLTPVQEIWTIVADAVEQQSKKVPGELGAMLRKNNQLYNAGKRFADQAAKRAAQKGGFKLSLGDLATGAGVGLATGNPLAGIATTIGSKVYKNVGTEVASKYLSNAAKHLARSPQKFGKYAPALQQAAQKGQGAFAAMYHVLAKKDPDFAKRMQKQLEEEAEE